jgi:glycosyltransferase involved in cell wall biosynthesis
MICSVVIPTIARGTLSRAVSSVLNQNFHEKDYEIIVVNDSGQPLPRESWQQHDQVKIIQTNRRERSFARNCGAALARGKFLHFLDDDDWLYPGALNQLRELTLTSPDADWYYGASQLMDREGNEIIQLRHGLNGNCFIEVMAGEWIPLQTSWIRSETFFSVGGFTPLVHATQDVDLSRKIGLIGDFAYTNAIVAYIEMGLERSSTDYDKAHQYSRWAREKILNQSGVFKRLRAAADESEWHGRMARIYLTSVVWNLAHKRFFTAASRGCFAALALLTAGIRLTRFDFWRSILWRYTSHSFSRGFQEMDVVDQASDSFKLREEVK